MKNTFGNSVAVTLFGESHGTFIGAVIDGLAPGIQIDREYIAHMLTLRRPDGKISTPRKEKDEFQIVSGVVGDKTTGTPITILIPNENVKSGDYSQMKPLRVLPMRIIRRNANTTVIRTREVEDILVVVSQRLLLRLGRFASMHWSRREFALALM